MPQSSLNLQQKEALIATYKARGWKNITFQNNGEVTLSGHPDMSNKKLSLQTINQFLKPRKI